MRATLGAIALALATGLMGWAWGDRNKIINHPDPILYRPALYSVHVRAIDAASKSPVNFRLAWDIEAVSKVGKGSEAATLQKFADGSAAAHLVGHVLPEGLRFKVVAEGYEAGEVLVQASASGIRTYSPDDAITVELLKSPAGSPSGRADPPDGR